MIVDGFGPAIGGGRLDGERQGSREAGEQVDSVADGGARRQGVEGRVRRKPNIVQASCARPRACRQEVSRVRRPLYRGRERGFAASNRNPT